MTQTTSVSDIKGIGAATARKLVAAGFETIEQLAEADPAAIQVIEGLPANADAAAWIEAAKASLEPVQEAEQGDVPVLVVTGPKKGFRRGGRKFDRTPTRIAFTDFAQDREGAAQMLAILREPALSCVIEAPVGVEIPSGEELIEVLEQQLASAD